MDSAETLGLISLILVLSIVLLGSSLTGQVVRPQIQVPSSQRPGAVVIATFDVRPALSGVRCSDSDSGAVYDVPGITKQIQGRGGTITVLNRQGDHCRRDIGQSQLVEYFCGRDGSVKGQYVDCRDICVEVVKEGQKVGYCGG